MCVCVSVCVYVCMFVCVCVCSGSVDHEPGVVCPMLLQTLYFWGCWGRFCCMCVLFVSFSVVFFDKCSAWCVLAISVDVVIHRDVRRFVCKCLVRETLCPV